MKIWIVKAGSQGVAGEKFYEKDVVAIGWNTIGDFPTSGSWEEFREEVRNKFAPGASNGQVGSAAGQLWSFIRVMEPGDYVITPITLSREVLVGKVTGEYKFDLLFDDQLPRTRSMKWYGKIQWDNVSPDLRSSFTVWQTIVQPKRDFMPLIQASQGKVQETPIFQGESAADGEVPSSGTEDLAASASEAIREMLQKMDHGVFQKFVGAVFVAAGFTELYNSANSGRDDGVDIILSKDPLGAGEKIIVQVKHVAGQIGYEELQRLVGTLKDREYGLVVTLNGLNGNAERYWRNNRDSLLRPMEATGLIDLLQANYERLSDEFKAILPLRRVFVPVNPESL